MVIHGPYLHKSCIISLYRLHHIIVYEFPSICHISYTYTRLNSSQTIINHYNQSETTNVILEKTLKQLYTLKNTKLSVDLLVGTQISQFVKNQDSVAHTMAKTCPASTIHGSAMVKTPPMAHRQVGSLHCMHS